MTPVQLRRTFGTVLALSLVLSAPAPALAQAPPIALDMIAPRGLDRSAFREDLGRRLQRRVSPRRSRAGRRLSRVLSITVRTDGERTTAHVYYRLDVARRLLLVVKGGALANDDTDWIVEAAVATVHTVEQWENGADHPEVVDPWIAGHQAESLQDPYENAPPPDRRPETEEPEVEVETMYVGRDILDPWREAVRRARRQRR